MGEELSALLKYIGYSTGVALSRKLHYIMIFKAARKKGLKYIERYEIGTCQFLRIFTYTLYRSDIGCSAPQLGL